jgi:hypothetical protein
MAEEDTNVLDSGLSQTLTPKEYQESFVDFYRQTLGSTGIDVRDDDDDDDDDDKKDKGPEVITAPPISGDDDRFVSSSMSPSVELINLDNIEASSYQDVLAKNNVEDITKFDSFGITFSKPSKPTLKKASTVFGATKLLFPTLGLVGADLATAVVGEERTEVDGQTGYRPPGGLGLMYDLNNSIQTANINANKLATQQDKLESEAADIAGTTHKRLPQGFSARINGQLVTRHHGKGYYEGVYDYTPEQLKSIEALRRGFNPSGYNLLTEQGDETIINTGVDRGYTPRGTYVDINGTAAAGPEKEFQKLVTNSITQYRLDSSRRKDIEKAIRGGLVKTRQGYSILGTKKEGAKTLNENIKDAIQQFKTQTTTTDQSDDPKPTTTTTTTFSPTNLPPADTFYDQSQDGGDDNNDSDAGVSQDTQDTYGDTGEADFDPVAMGGRIGKQEGDVVVKEPGFIAPDPNATKQQEIADDKPMDARQGDFIINAPAAEEAGKQDIQRMINVAITNLQEKGVDVRFGDPKINIADKVKLLVSRNEVYIPAIIAKEIGYDRLKKINNRGKREVQRRQEESQQDEKPQARGFIQKKKGDVVQGGIGAGFIDYDALRRRYGTTDMDQIIQKSVAGMFGVREQGEKAQEIAYNFARQNKFKDDDKSEDTLRHIIGGGLMADKKLGFTVYNLKENPYVNMIYGGLKGQGFTLPTGKAKQEGEIDLNNNEFGKALRQKYPNEKEFIKQAKRYLMDLRAGKEVKPVNGFRPMMSLGIIQREN